MPKHTTYLLKKAVLLSKKRKKAADYFFYKKNTPLELTARVLARLTQNFISIL